MRHMVTLRRAAWNGMQEGASWRGIEGMGLIFLVRFKAFLTVIRNRRGGRDRIQRGFFDASGF
jgi:hypothetical protein